MIDAMQWFQLNGKKAMVTGGAAGLCYAMAEGLHLAGAEVVLVDRSPAVGEAAARLGAQGAPVHGVQGDLSHWEGIPALYDRALAALGGRGDILVNGAGIQYRCPAEDFPPGAVAADSKDQPGRGLPPGPAGGANHAGPGGRADHQRGLHDLLLWQ